MKLEEAIDKLKETQDSYLKDELDLAIETVLQKLEHLQKENEEYSKQLDLDYVDENFVSKDKIREKIEEYRRQYEKENEQYVKDIIGLRILALDDLLRIY